MPRYKQPDAPKFEPVFIADCRPAIHSILTPESERAKIQSEDFTRIVGERTIASIKRLGVLQEYLGLSGGLGEAKAFELLLAVAIKYVPGFGVEVGARPKTGPKKIADRFKTVTEVERRKFERDLPSISAAIESVAIESTKAIRPQELSTKYYAYLREIEANEQAHALLRFWRRVMPWQSATDLQDFEVLFWECERSVLGADRPHNVRPLKSRKS
jgi:hypothetical protein